MERALHSIAGAISTAVLMVLFGLMVLHGRCNCGTVTDESRCDEDCRTRAQVPGHDREVPRFNGTECWCFDPKSGQSTRLW